MWRMASYGPFGHLHHKLCAKEGSGVKLPIKSQESTRPRCVQAKCGTPLESSQGELRVCFRPHPNWRSKQGVMSCQNPGNPNRDNFGTISRLPLGNPRTKSHLDVAPMEWRIVYYCRNSTLTKCEGEAQHLEKVGIGVLRDSRKFRRRFGRPKHLTWGCSWCHWKGLET